MTEGNGTTTGHDRPTAGRDDQPFRPLAEVAVLMGMHPEALRSLVRRDQVPARRDNRGKWLVAVPAGHQDSKPVNDRSTTGHDDALAELQEELAEARVRIARLEERTEARVKAAEQVSAAEVAMARAEVRARERYIAQLERLLAEERRPWWRRLVG